MRSHVAASMPATQPSNIKDFEKGIRIDWQHKEVLADATVIMREGLIEVFACSPKEREHEAIVRLEARPLHLYQAIGLIGLQPGHPLRMNERTQKVEAATGSPVEIDVRYERAGQKVQEPIENWMRGVQTKKTPTRLPWVFAGSVKSDEGFAADFEGTVIALVDFASSLIALPEQHSSSNSELWLEPATTQIPTVGTHCTLVVRAGPTRITMDATGRIALEGERVSRAELARRLSAMLKENPHLRVEFAADSECSKSDREAVERLIRLLGVEDRNLTTSRPGADARPVHDPGAMTTWLRQALSSASASSPDTHVAESAHQLVEDLRERTLMLRGRTEHVADYFSAVSQQLRAFFEPDQGRSKPPSQRPDNE